MALRKSPFARPRALCPLCPHAFSLAARCPPFLQYPLGHGGLAAAPAGWWLPKGIRGRAPTAGRRGRGRRPAPTGGRSAGPALPSGDQAGYPEPGTLMLHLAPGPGAKVWMFLRGAPRGPPGSPPCRRWGARFRLSAASAPRGHPLAHLDAPCYGAPAAAYSPGRRGPVREHNSGKAFPAPGLFPPAARSPCRTPADIPPSRITSSAWGCAVIPLLTRCAGGSRRPWIHPPARARRSRAAA